MKVIESCTLLLPRILAFVLLSGCAMSGNLHQNCKVFDADLSQGTYNGGCNDGLADGYGEVTGISSYRGEFLAGKKNGKGIKVMPNGDRYEGDFNGDYRNGHGVYIWGKASQWAGDRYEGEYRHDQRDGWGVYQWNSGDRYEGEWKNDLRMGPSVMESRRAQAAKAEKKALALLRTGMEVCANERWDQTNYQLIRGTVESLAENKVSVRIVEVEGGMASLKGSTLTAGKSFTDEVTHWQTCKNF